MKSVMKSAMRAVDSTDRLLIVFCQILMFAMLLQITLDVVLRYLFRAPTFWGFELCGYMNVAIAVLPAAHLVREKAHIRVNILADLLRPKVRKVLTFIISIAALAYTAVVAWKGTQMALLALVRNAHANTPLSPPLFYIEGIIPFGFIVFAVAILVNMYRQVIPEGPAAGEKVEQTIH